VAFKKTKKKPKEKTEVQSSTKPASDAEALAFIDSLKKAGKLGDISRKIDFVSTGSWVVNRLIGDGSHQNRPGGVPRGYVTEIYGEEGCGKTTLALHIAKQAQEAGFRVVYADFEKSLRQQYKYIQNIGVNIAPPNFLHLEPDNFEDGVKTIGLSMMKLQPAVIIVDSVTAMLPKAAFEGDADESVQVGLHAKLTGWWLNWITKRLQKRNCALVLVNQMRSNIKADKYDPGPKEITSGGKAVRFFTSLRIHMRPQAKEMVEEISDITGVSEKKAISQTVKVIVEKNKLDMPFKSGPIYIQFGHGIDNVMSMIELAINRRIIKKEGAWFSWKDAGSDMQFKVQGKQGLKRHLEENPEILEVIKPKLQPSRDDTEMDETYRRLEAKRESGSLTQDETEELRAIRKIKGLSVDDLELSSEEADELKELDSAIEGEKEDEE
jgi:recombination protein RecA